MQISDPDMRKRTVALINSERNSCLIFREKYRRYDHQIAAIVAQWRMLERDEIV